MNIKLCEQTVLGSFGRLHPATTKVAQTSREWDGLSTNRPDYFRWVTSPSWIFIPLVKSESLRSLADWGFHDAEVGTGGIAFWGLRSGLEAQGQTGQWEGRHLRDRHLEGAKVTRRWRRMTPKAQLSSIPQVSKGGGPVLLLHARSFPVGLSGGLPIKNRNFTETYSNLI